MNYMLSERAARALRRLLNDQGAVVPASVSQTRRARPDFAQVAGGGGDCGAFAIKKVDGVDTITNGWIMFSRCSGPISVRDRAIDSAGVYSVTIKNSSPFEEPTWTVQDSAPRSTATTTYVPIVAYEADGDKLKMSADYRRMPIVPAYDFDY